MSNLEEIEVRYQASTIDDNTVLVTSAATADWIAQRSEEILRSALEQTDGKPQSSVFLKDTTTSDELTLATIDALAIGLNSNRDNLLKANAIILQKILEDAFFGEAYQSIVANINSDYKVIYDSSAVTSKDTKKVEAVRAEVDAFLRDIKIRQLIRDVIAMAYAEGNVPLVLRMDNSHKPVVDILPLSVAYPSEYRRDGRSVLEFDVKALKDKINKTYKKSKKTKKAIFFENMKKDVEANYPADVYKAYVAGEDYVRLNPDYSDCVKFNDLGRRFGVSPLFRCLRPLLVLEQIENADVSDSKARAKKILFQKLRKEALGQDGNRKGLDLAAYAHQQGAAALQTSSAFYTAAPFVESLEYVQVKNTTEQAINQQKQYTQKLLTGLGIVFTDSQSSVSAGSIGVKQLVRTINAIGENLETVLNKFIETWIVFKGYEARFAPTIRVIDAEQLEMDMRQSMARFIYGTLNGSVTTAFAMLGLDAEDELAKRKMENDKGYDKIFFPRKTAYTNDGEENNGRPKGEETDRQVYDKTYNDNAR